MGVESQTMGPITQVGEEWLSASLKPVRLIPRIVEVLGFSTHE